MGVFSENITSELSLMEKVRFAIEEVLDIAVDLVNNHFSDCQQNRTGSESFVSRYLATVCPPDTITAFVRESDRLLRKLCGSEFGNSCGLLIVAPIFLEIISSSPITKKDSTSTYKVKVHVDCFIDDSSFSTTGEAIMYNDIDFFYEKTIYDHPHV